MNAKTAMLDRDAWDFAPGILAIQEQPPSPLPRLMLNVLMLLVATLLVWAWFGNLDIIAVAEGKLVPRTYVKIVQPADAGILKDILVDEGDHVHAGQVLMRMDTQIAQADTRILQVEVDERALQLRRIDAELTDAPFVPAPSIAEHDARAAVTATRPGIPTRPTEGEGRGEAEQHQYPSDLIAQIEAQYQSHRQAYGDALAQEQAGLAKAHEDLAAAEQVRQKLAAILPTYQQEEAALVTLGNKALAAKVDVLEKQRNRIEAEQDLRAQERTVQSLKAGIAQSERKLAQITSNYRQQLQNERIDAQAQFAKIEQELAKQRHKNTLLELKASQAGIIKDVATHTIGAVVNPGTILLTLVPLNETLQAEVMVKNDDIGFVHEGQFVKLKLAAYPFQKYGLVEGKVIHVSADADEARANRDTDPRNNNTGTDEPRNARLNYKAIVQLQAQAIDRGGERYDLTPGMQVVAEINQGQRTVFEYLLSPVRGVFHDAWRER